jgi:hypothetical protein
LLSRSTTARSPYGGYQPANGRHPLQPFPPGLEVARFGDWIIGLRYIEQLVHFVQVGHGKWPDDQAFSVQNGYFFHVRYIVQQEDVQHHGS